MIEEIKGKIRDTWNSEEKIWFQRARINWLNFRDKNTRFFHQTTMQRRRRNKVLKVKDANGVWCEEEIKVIECYANYYQGLFKINGPRDWGSVLNEIPTLVLREMNIELTIEVTNVEIIEVVFHMGMYKALGPDRFSGGFFQKYWNIVRGEVIEAVRGFFRIGHMLRELNRT